MHERDHQEKTVLFLMKPVHCLRQGAEPKLTTLDACSVKTKPSRRDWPLGHAKAFSEGQWLRRPLLDIRADRSNAEPRRCARLQLPAAGRHMALPCRSRPTYNENNVEIGRIPTPLT
jgi:hypothetical protein